MQTTPIKGEPAHELETRVVTEDELHYLRAIEEQTRAYLRWIIERRKALERDA